MQRWINVTDIRITIYTLKNNYKPKHSLPSFFSRNTCPAPYCVLATAPPLLSPSYSAPYRFLTTAQPGMPYSNSAPYRLLATAQPDIPYSNSASYRNLVTALPNRGHNPFVFYPLYSPNPWLSTMERTSFKSSRQIYKLQTN